MNPREKILAAAVASLLVLVGLGYVYGRVQQQFQTRSLQTANLQRDISQKQLQVQRGQLAGRRLAEYERRSLPPDRELARSLYQNWLIGLVEKCKLAGGVTSQSPQASRGAYDRHSFTFSGQGTLDQVTQFLHEFYSADHLHQIRLLSLRPLADAKRMDVLIAIEAIALPEADPNTQIGQQQANLQWGELAAYRKPITDRNLFGPYAPPSPPRPSPPAFDVARHTRVSAIIADGGRMQVWLNVLTTGKLLQLYEGDTFEVGAVRGAIQRITEREIEVQIDGKRWLLSLGENLREATPLPDGEL